MKKIKYILLLLICVVGVFSFDEIKAETITCNYGAIRYTYNSDTGNVTSEILDKDNCKTTSACVVQNIDKTLFLTYGKLTCPELCCNLKTTVLPGTAMVMREIKVERLYVGQTCEKNLCTKNSTSGSITDSNTTVGETPDGSTVTGIMFPSLNFGDRGETCEEFLGANNVKLIKTARIAIQTVSVIITIVIGMITFIPPIMNKDNNALSKAFNKFITILIVLAVILLLPTIVKVIGLIAGFDISCI